MKVAEMIKLLLGIDNWRKELSQTKAPRSEQIETVVENWVENEILK